MSDPIVIVGLARTPMGGFQGELSGATASQLGAVAIKAALERAGIGAEDVDEVLMGNVLSAGQGQAPARQAAFAAGLPKSVPCTTLNKMCGSGMKTAMIAHDQLLAGNGRVVVAGGMESMTNAPYLLPKMRGGARLGHARSPSLAAPRILFALAEHRQLPAWFARIHTRHATPYNSILVMGAMALALGLSSNFVSLAVGSSVVRLLGYIVCIAALPRIRQKADPETRRNAFRLPGGYAIPGIAMIVCLWLVMQSQMEDWLRVSALLAAGLALYAVANYRRDRRSDE